MVGSNTATDCPSDARTTERYSRLSCPLVRRLFHENNYLLGYNSALNHFTLSHYSRGKPISQLNSINKAESQAVLL